MTRPSVCCGRATMIAGALLLVTTAELRAEGLRAGLWKVVQTPEINGAATPPQQSTRCLTVEAVADLDKTFSPVSRTTNSACERVEHESTPERLKWRLQCKGQLDMDVAGEFVFETPERYSAVVTTQASMIGQVMQSSRVTIVAERIGECQ